MYRALCCIIHQHRLTQHMILSVTASPASIDSLMDSSSDVDTERWDNSLTVGISGDQGYKVTCDLL